MSVRDFIRYCNTVGLSTGIRTFPWTPELNQSFMDLVAHQQGKLVKSLVIAQGYREKIIMTTFFDKRRIYLQDTELIRPLDKAARIAAFSSSILESEELTKVMDRVNVGQIYVNPYRTPLIVEPHSSRLSIVSYFRK
jgi:hypothetical protein